MSGHLDHSAILLVTISRKMPSTSSRLISFDFIRWGKISSAASMVWVGGQKYQLKVAGLVEFPPGLLVLDLEDAIVDVAAGLFADDAANPAKMLHEVLGALVGVVLRVGHGVVGKRVDDGDSGVLNRPPLTVVLSMVKENIMSNQILAQRDIPTCLFSNIITHLPTLHFFSCSS